MTAKIIRSATRLQGYGPNSTKGPTGQAFRFFAVGDDDSPTKGTLVEIYKTGESHDPQEVGKSAAGRAAAHIGERTILGTQARKPIIDLVLSDGVVHVVSFYRRNALKGTKPATPLDTDWPWIVGGWNSIAKKVNLPTLSLGQQDEFLSGNLDDMLVGARIYEPESDAEGMVIGYARGLWRAYEAEESATNEIPSDDEFMTFTSTFLSALRPSGA